MLLSIFAKLQSLFKHDYQEKLERYISGMKPETAAEIDNLINQFIKTEGKTKWHY
jgi:hypothetical protein